MEKQQQVQKTASPQSTATSTPANFLQTRPFAPVENPPVAERQEKPNLREQIEWAERFNCDRISSRSQPLYPQPKLTLGRVGDKYEQEADRVAQQVVQRLNTLPTQELSIQRQEMREDEELQLKPQPLSIQRQDVPESDKQLQKLPIIQRVSRDGDMAVIDELEASIHQARGRGQPLLQRIREPMEQSFGADFSGVRIHADAQSDQLNQSIQARAFTTGQNIFFRQGAYEPGSRGGQELIAHELTHVVQQNGSLVQRQSGDGMKSRNRGELTKLVVSQLGVQPNIVQRGWFDQPETIPSLLTPVKKLVEQYNNSNTDVNKQRLIVDKLLEFVNKCLFQAKNTQGMSQVNDPNLKSQLENFKLELESKQNSLSKVESETKKTTQNLPPPPELKPLPLKKEETPQKQVGKKPVSSPVKKIPKTETEPLTEKITIPKDTFYYRELNQNNQPTGDWLEDPGYTTAVTRDSEQKVNGGHIIWQKGQKIWYDPKPTLIKIPPGEFYYKRLIDKKPTGDWLECLGWEKEQSKVSQGLVDGGHIIHFKFLKSKESWWLQDNPTELPQQQSKDVGISETLPDPTLYHRDKKISSTLSFVPLKKETLLFPNGAKPEHVLQGELGDCYLMAALASITKKNPQYVEKMLTDNGETVTVTLFDRIQTSSFKHKYVPRKIVVNKSVAKKGQKEDVYAKNNLWVQMIEKAYAAGGFSGNLLKKFSSGSYENIQSGFGRVAFEVFLGEKASFMSLEPLGGKGMLKGELLQEHIYKQIDQALKEGKVVTAATRKLKEGEETLKAKVEGLGHSAGEFKLQGIVADHAYSVLEVKQEKQKMIVKLRNPWGQYGRTLNEDMAEGIVKEGDGTVELYMNQFLDRFTNLSIGGQKWNLNK